MTINILLDIPELKTEVPEKFKHNFADHFVIRVQKEVDYNEETIGQELSGVMMEVLESYIKYRESIK